MDYCATTDQVTFIELQAVQGILAGVTVALDEVERNMPLMQCTWRGTAFEAYAANVNQLFTQFAALVSNIADARAAIASAISAA